MNTKLLIWIVSVFLGAVVVATVWYFVFAKNVAPETTQSNTTLPVSGSVAPTPEETSSATSSPIEQKMTLTIQNSEMIVVNDFIHNNVTIPDTANIGRYMLAGNLGYCLSDPQKCQAAQVTNFNVYYNSIPQSFTIALIKEPIGQARLDMEQFMLTTLGITKQQMCNLNYYVGVTRYVNEQYTGKNLGFSVCPGATKLPN